MANAEKLKKLIHQRGIIKGQITNFSNFLEVYQTEAPNAFKLNDRLAKFKVVFEKFDEVQTELELLTDEAVRDTAIRERFDIQDDYYNVLALAQECVANLTPPVPQNVLEHADNTPQSGTPQSLVRKRRVKLPEASLPIFSGKYEDWLSFKDSFTSLIDSQDDLTNVEKLQYLKSAVKGEAANKIKNISITDDNYKRAWELLQKGYADQRLIIAKHLTLLLRLPVQEQETAEGLRRLADETQQHIESLSALKITVSPEILVQNIELKLHRKTAEKWEETLEHGVFPKLEKLIDFLYATAARLSKHDDDISDRSEEKRSGANHHNTQARGRGNPKKQNTFLSSTSKTRKCPVCSDPQHPIWRCKKFLGFGLPKRVQVVKEASLCLLCLRQHGEKACKFNKCFACDRAQNVLLHEHESDSNKS